MTGSKRPNLVVRMLILSYQLVWGWSVVVLVVSNKKPYLPKVSTDRSINGVHSLLLAPCTSSKVGLVGRYCDKNVVMAKGTWESADERRKKPRPL